MDIHLSILVGAEKLLLEERRANEARRAFMKYIFHEVRTPLNSLTMGIDLLSMSPHIAEFETEPLTIMKAASEFMSQTLDSVLSMHKIEEGKYELEPQPFSLEQSLRKICMTFSGALLKKKIKLTVTVSPETPPVLIGDGTRLEHVMSNLLSNSIKFSPRESLISAEIIFESSSLQPDGSGKAALVSVVFVDHGPGISESNQLLLFNNFVQIRPGSLQEGQGSGLGLSFCKHIVTMHNGTIGVTSDGTNGSSFKFTIPYPVATDAQLSRHQSKPKGSEGISGQFAIEAKSLSNNVVPLSAVFNPLYHHHTAAPSSESTNSPNKCPSIALSSINPGAVDGGDATVDTTAPSEVHDTIPSLMEASTPAFHRSTNEALVVDDADSNRKILVMLLKKKGLRSVEAANGQLALDIALADLHRFKLIFMDNLMPVMHGIDATKRLRAAGYPYIIIGITGNVMDQDIKEYLSVGANMVISKPLQVGTLFLLIDYMEAEGALVRPGMVLEHTPEKKSISWVPRMW